MSYRLEFAASVKPQLEALTAKQRSTVIDAIEKHIVHQPLVETRNRKRLRPNLIAPWELRVQDFRVFYEVEEFDVEESDAPQENALDEQGIVHVLAVGRKKGNILWVGDKKVQL